jgi:hypothetical protein
MPKANPSCWRSVDRGCRRFMSATAAAGSWLGPFAAPSHSGREEPPILRPRQGWTTGAKAWTLEDDGRNGSTGAAGERGSPHFDAGRLGCDYRAAT